MLRLLALALVTSFVGASAPAADPPPLAKKEWKVGDAAREALIYAPATAKEKPAPLIFAFHGHGGTMTNAAKGFALHKHWPEAIVVYMQGLPTPGRLTDPEGKKSGWQSGPGQQGDRDLKFFDEVLASMRKEYKVDDKRIYATGHSNGGSFTYILWGVRGDTFAAVGPSGSPAGMVLGKLKPLPCLHVAGSKDPLVKYEWQRETMNAVRKLNGCDAEGKPDGKGLTVFESKGGTPLIEYVYDGGHAPPADAFEKIAAFFKQQAKK